MKKAGSEVSQAGVQSCIGGSHVDYLQLILPLGFSRHQPVPTARRCGTLVSVAQVATAETNDFNGHLYNRRGHGLIGRNGHAFQLARSAAITISSVQGVRDFATGRRARSPNASGAPACPRFMFPVSTGPYAFMSTSDQLADHCCITGYHAKMYSMEQQGTFFENFNHFQWTQRSDPAKNRLSTIALTACQVSRAVDTIWEPGSKKPATVANLPISVRTPSSENDSRECELGTNQACEYACSDRLKITFTATNGNPSDDRPSGISSTKSECECCKYSKYRRMSA
ncbi:hypothetical protein HW555_010088 [Spodoptera exigua]|uniref:Uncharacterized protein n=1 Tax=Spodoptera exigua TaxID=7107 RepID=A0A835GB91_SPOEX|nr:hypothetical protein HW555_010088 [Spodoptera exigua]